MAADHEVTVELGCWLTDKKIVLDMGRPVRHLVMGPEMARSIALQLLSMAKQMQGGSSDFGQILWDEENDARAVRAADGRGA
jgi:hypothetical protein